MTIRKMKECPFCHKDDGLEICWEELVGYLYSPHLHGYNDKERGHGDRISIRCNCGAVLTESIDGINMDLWDKYGMDVEVTEDMVEDEIIRIWNRDEI